MVFKTKTVLVYLLKTDAHITGTAVHLGTYDRFERMIPTDSGYFLLLKSYNNSTTVVACDREWNK